jgi:hypothetical protein
MNEDFSPSRIFNRIIHFWWVLALFIILGGIVGILISRVHPPVYESKAVITSVLDYSLLGKIDDTEEDQVFVGIGETIGSTTVKNAVVARAKNGNVALTDEEIRSSLFLDRQDNRWVLRVRLSDPQLAQKIDQYWSESAMQSLAAMKAKALVDFAAQQHINSLVTCLQQSVILESGSASCNGQNFAAIQAEITKTVSDPDVQGTSNSLLIWHTSFELTSRPSLPNEPALFGQNLSALAGMAVALLLGLVLFSIDFPAKSGTESDR